MKPARRLGGSAWLSTTALLLGTAAVLDLSVASRTLGGAAQSRVARQSSATTTDVGCTDVSATRISCEDLNLQVIPIVEGSTVTRLDLRGNTIHDGSGTLTSTQVGNGKVLVDYIHHLTWHAQVGSHASITELQLQANGIVDIETGTFDNFGTLLILRLFGNGITALEAGSFRGLTSLTTLWLNSNPLSSLVSGVFSPFASTLSFLRLNDCTSLDTLEDNSLNALQLPVDLNMDNALSLCALAPITNAIECVCRSGLVGGLDGYCAASLATAAPVAASSAPTLAPSAPPSDGSDRESDLETDADPAAKSAKGKKGKGKVTEADDAGQNRDSDSVAAKGKKGASEADGELRDGTSTTPEPKTPKQKSAKDSQGEDGEFRDGTSTTPEPKIPKQKSVKGSQEEDVEFRDGTSTTPEPKAPKEKSTKGTQVEDGELRVGDSTTAPKKAKYSSVGGDAEVRAVTVQPGAVIFIVGGVLAVAAAMGMMVKRQYRAKQGWRLQTIDYEDIEMESNHLLPRSPVPISYNTAGLP